MSSEEWGVGVMLRGKKGLGCHSWMRWGWGRVMERRVHSSRMKRLLLQLLCVLQSLLLWLRVTLSCEHRGVATITHWCLQAIILVTFFCFTLPIEL